MYVCVVYQKGRMRIKTLFIRKTERPSKLDRRVKSKNKKKQFIELKKQQIVKTKTTNRQQFFVFVFLSNTILKCELLNKRRREKHIKRTHQIHKLWTLLANTLKNTSKNLGQMHSMSSMEYSVRAYRKRPVARKYVHI